MARSSNERRRESTILRDNQVHKAYEGLKDELGCLFVEVSKSFIYERIRQRTGLCYKTIAYILNHTSPKFPKRGK